MPGFLNAKRQLFKSYRAAFASLSGMLIVGEPADCRSNFWLQTLQLPSDNLALRDAILEATAEAGYMARPIWTPLHKMRPYADCPRMPITVTQSLEQRLINLPSSSGLAG